MDAQNAVESTSAKQPASPRRGSDNESTHPRNRSPVANKTAASSTTTTTTTTVTKDLKPPPNTSSNATDEDAAHERDSDAETIVLPGKDGISPSKPRKVIKHEDKSDGEIDDHVLPAPKKLSREAKDLSNHGERSAAGDDAASSVRQKKRPLEKQRVRDGSAGLSSAPTSPPIHLQREQSSSHRRRNHGNHDSGSDSETPKPRSPKLSKEKGTPIERHLSHKRKAHKTESDDDADARKIRRPRVSETGLESRSKDSKSMSSKPHLERHSASRPRSISPHVRAHRRSLSTQLPDKSYASGLGSKKRRIPAPLQSTDYHSDDSSASGSPHPRSSRLKSIVTPGTGDSTMSPAKLAPHKKHLDAHGQTLFAKACAKGEYDVAKTRLAERPEDLNFADHAGNTPLQVASLNGHEDVVELLIGAGCNLECRNDVKDTPLLDAVENGHLGVVKLLLAAGVNPRKANAEGQEPLEKVPDDLDNAEEIRQALIEAKQKVGELRRTSEDHAPQDNQDTSSHGANSPRRSPEPSLGAVLAASSRRGGTVRSTKTSNHLLYMSLDEKTLRQAAARGDHETVTRILQVKESCDDAEALVAAARGGHNFVMELLLALGGANPDPSPVASLPGEHSTPMLAAIGQENIKVVQLLLEQNGFDPTRRFRGETYYEIARRREGPMWKEEEHMLKNAYDEYKKTHKGHSKNKVSPSRRERDLAGQEAKRVSRAENNAEKPRPQHKRRPSSPPREGDAKKKVNSGKTASSPKEKKRSQSFSQNDEQVSPKRGRPKKEDKVPTIAISDREASPALSAKTHPVKPKRSESDMAGSSEGETAKPRRKLISGKDLKGQRDKQRRSSMVSNHSAKDATERHDSKIDDSTEKPRAERISEKYHDRTKALKRDDSRDRLSPNDPSAKRLRASMTPPRHGADDKDENEAPVKRRKLDADGKENRGLKNPPADDRPRKRDSSGEPIKRQKLADGDRKDVLKAKKLNRERKESEKASSEKPESTTASEDVEMRDAPEVPSAEDREAALDKERAESRKRQAELEAAEEEARKKAEAIKQREAEEKQKREADEKRLQEEAEKKRAEEEEKRRLEEAERKRKEEAQAKLEAERQKREEEAKKAREEEERLQKEKEDQRRRQEEERVRLEKEAAEEARRLREEEERRERERKRAARDAELLRQRQEQEREQEKLRLSKLPPLLRWLDGCADPKQREYAQLFTIMQGVRYDTINPLATGAQGREQWLLNTQVALLLGEKDLSLQRYTGWERIPVSNIAKRVIWRLEQDRYALTESKLYHLGEQLPGYYGGDPSKVGYQRLEKLRRDASKLFFDMDMFFVKESDLLFILPSIPHLRNVKLSICYRELPEHENQLNFWTAPAKWKSDPDANTREGFAPRQKYYINGRLDGEDRPGHYNPSTSPFPDQRVPRRGGLIAVGPEEPDYPQLCLEQGLGHLLSEHQKLMAMNAAHLTPRSMTSNDTADGPNGDNMSPSAASPTTRVNGNYERGSPEAPLVNGTNGIAH
ncbi:hypothetical protein PFICI_03780 [Pestalotiopsis fici W106-1]|uniref:Uncharacterized protein n=1 Tax=Pestalotiopsis fici (strain W106-1 / CGMCC3.15140) TaxID=1229662 RepID=W3XIB6_PESFW|nr:uncharacterized protein PFICI_03780 [Pestalotiopsis fici W106-1]ETS85755.1 hypothetical protein PFICI_03780 [Pestalotiopsis fici W106-1]